MHICPVSASHFCLSNSQKIVPRPIEVHFLGIGDVYFLNHNGLSFMMIMLYFERKEETNQLVLSM